MRLLIAEDEQELSNALGAYLRHHGFSVDIVDNGGDALDYVLAGEYDCLVLDIMMPVQDGITVLKALRDKRNTTPVILLTAKSGLGDKINGLDSGADDYVTKPFSSQELLSRIRAVTRRQSKSGIAGSACGNTTLNKNTFELEAPGGSARLTNKEFQMIEILMDNPGILISTERFMDRVWGCDSDADVNVVWVYISALRKKLASIGSNAAIKVSRGVGYALEAQSD